MCLTLLLISNSPIAACAGGEEFPGLEVLPLDGDFEPTLRFLQQHVPAPNAAWVSPLGNCACGFGYQCREHLEVELAIDDYRDSQLQQPSASSPAERRAATWSNWELNRLAVNSFSKYLEHKITEQDLSLYVCWDNRYAVPYVERQPLTPAYFTGEGVPVPREDRVHRIAPNDDPTAFGSAPRMIANELIALAQKRGLELAPNFRGSRFEHNDRQIRVAPLFNAIRDSEGTEVEYVISGAVKTPPHYQPIGEHDFHGRWTEVGKLPDLETAVHFTRAWLVDGCELDVLNQWPFEFNGWPL